jgi:CBS domain-containing protein
MTTNVATIRPDASIQEAIELLLDKGISGMPVVDQGGHLVGMITEFALLAIAYDHNVQSQSVAQHMTREVITVDVSEAVSRIADLCIVHRVRRVPVMDGPQLVGLITRRDVLRALSHADKLLCHA